MIKELKPGEPTDPNGEFHECVVVTDSTVTVYVNGSREPSLVVTSWGNRTPGLVGLWVGNGSRGNFANLTITPRKQP
jgi:hypothetical protein